MKNKIVSMKGDAVEVPEGEANAAVIELLHDALRRAKLGEIQHIAICYTDNEGRPGGTFDGRPAYVSWAIERMRRRLHAMYDGSG